MDRQFSELRTNLMLYSKCNSWKRKPDLQYWQ